MELHFGVILLFVLLAFLFVFATLTIGRYFRPNNPYPDKKEIYECGERPIGPAWMQFNPRFYLIALIFLIFDVEIAFVFPIATVFKSYVDKGGGYGMLAFIELFIFMAVLLLGLIFVWIKGDLHWVKKLKGPQN